MRVWHEDSTVYAGTAAFVVYLPPLTASHPDFPAYAADLDPVRLARMLALFTSTIGATLHVSPQVTSTDMILDSRRGGKIRKARVIDLQATVEPPPPALISTLENDTVWSRALLEEEKRLPFLHMYDRGGSYLPVCSSLKLGYGKATYYEQGTTFNPDIPGYHRIEVVGEDRLAGDWRMPHPLWADGKVGRAGLRWYSTPTLTLAYKDFGMTIEPVESYVWEDDEAPADPRTPRSGATALLAPWYKQLKASRAVLEEMMAGGDDLAADVREMHKMLYAWMSGYFAKPELEGKPLYRPDWRHHITAAARSNILRLIHGIGTEHAIWPVAIFRDAIVYVSDNPCPWCAWPGAANKLGRGLGEYKPTKSGLLADHAGYLTGDRYRGNEDLTKIDSWVTEHPCPHHPAPASGGDHA